MDIVQVQDLTGITPMSRRDLVDNFEQHYEGEIGPLCRETRLETDEALQLYSPFPDDPNRPMDALMDVGEQHNLRFVSQGGVAPSPCNFAFETTYPRHVISCAYMRKLPKLAMGEPLLTPVAEQSFSRSDLNSVYNRPNYTRVETDRVWNPRLRVMDIVGYTETVLGSTIEVPILINPNDVSTFRPTGEGLLPRWSMDVDKGSISTSEIGFEFAITDRTRRSSTITLPVVARALMTKAKQLNNYLVNALLGMLASKVPTGTNSHRLSWTKNTDTGAVKPIDINKLQLQPDDDYMITNCIGDIDSIAALAATDPTFMSQNMRPFYPTFRFIDEMMGLQSVAKRDPAKVEGLSANELFFWQRECGIALYLERGGNINKTYDENPERQTVIQVALNYAARAMEDFLQCAYIVALS